MSIREKLIEITLSRKPDFVVGGADDPYMLRWIITPWSKVGAGVKTEDKTLWQRFCSFWPGIYVHRFLRSDDDRALHDHPYLNASILLEGMYTEHTIAAGGIHVRTLRTPGRITFRRAKAAHRVELTHGRALSLFLCGFRLRDFGFHCPERGWVHWRKFTSPTDSGAVGKGCNQ